MHGLLRSFHSHFFWVFLRSNCFDPIAGDMLGFRMTDNDSNEADGTPQPPRWCYPPQQETRGYSRAVTLTVAGRKRIHTHRCRLSSLRNKRPDLSGRPHCKGVAIGVARRGARRGGERTLRIPPSCSFPVSHACGPHVASFVRRSSVRARARVRAGVARAPRKRRSAALPKRFPAEARINEDPSRVVLVGFRAPILVDAGLAQRKEVGDRASGSLRATGPLPWSRQ